MVFKMGFEDRAFLVIGQSDDPLDAGLDVVKGVNDNQQGQTKFGSRKISVRASTIEWQGDGFRSRCPAPESC